MIGIAGASGQLGQATLALLLQKLPGEKVVAISRTPEAAAPAGAGRRRGDFNEYGDLVKAFTGLDRLMILPTRDLRPGMREVQHLNAVKAAIEAGVGHILFMSAAGTGQGHDNILDECYFPPEQALMRGAKEWTILRMSIYQEVLLDQALQSLAKVSDDEHYPGKVAYVASESAAGTLVSASRARISYVARDDVAAAAAGILLGQHHHGMIYNATGPQAWTLEAKAALVAEVSGRPVSGKEVTVAQYAEGLRQAKLPEYMVEMVLNFEAHIARGGYDVVTGDIEHITGRPPQGLREFLMRHRSSLVG